MCLRMLYLYQIKLNKTAMKNQNDRCRPLLFVPGTLHQQGTKRRPRHAGVWGTAGAPASRGGNAAGTHLGVSGKGTEAGVRTP